MIDIVNTKYTKYTNYIKYIKCILIINHYIINHLLY